MIVHADDDRPAIAEVEIATDGVALVEVAVVEQLQAVAASSPIASTIIEPPPKVFFKSI